MAYNVTTDQTIANFQAEVGKVVELLKRGTYPAQLVSPATITALSSLINTANGTSQIALS